MKITLRPYANDKSRWHVDIRIMNPCNPEKEIRKRKVAPAGLSEAQARAWGERQVPKILRKVLGSDDAKEVRPEPANIIPLHTARRGDMSLGEFYIERFEPEHVRMQKHATRVSYDSYFRNHIAPHLGDVPLAALDEDRLSAFRAKLAARLRPSTANQVLTKVAKMLRFAKRLRLISVVPDVDKLPTPRKRPKVVYSDEQIEELLEAARSVGASTELVCLLALDAGLRASEICALEWGDVDLKGGTITVQHNSYRGTKQTPKGTIGKVALTSALRSALADHRKREPIGPLVLYRKSHWTAGEWRPHTPHSIRYEVNLAQQAAGFDQTGPHMLRHTALTRLAKLGASVYLVQAVARHSRLQTTETYLHTQQVECARDAADLLDRAAKTRSRGKAVAKAAKSRKK